MKNVTITFEEDVAKWARVKAAEADTSLLRYVGNLLKGKMTDKERYKAAHRMFMAVEPERLCEPGDKYPTRDEIYDRHLR
jgi:hypothetical protein